MPNINYKNENINKEIIKFTLIKENMKNIPNLIEKLNNLYTEYYHFNNKSKSIFLEKL